MDISISRKHCQILLNDKGYFIEDRRSKYGTLIKSSEPLQIKKDEKIVIQIGNTLLCMNYETKYCLCK